MVYMKWTTDEFLTLESSVLYTEVDDDGWVQRELTIAADGSVEERLVPSVQQPGWFGLARLSGVMLEDHVTRDEFESMWQGGGADLQPERP